MSERKLLKIFARNIKNRRKALNLTQAKLASIIDVSSSFITEIETEKRAPSFATIEALAEALKTPAWVLFCDTADHTKDFNFESNSQQKMMLVEKMNAVIDEVFSDM